MVFIFSAIIGALFGFIGSRILFVGQWYSLIIWAFVGLCIGYFSKTKKQSTLSGSIFGFFLFFIFMVVGYNGIRPLTAVLPFFIIIGLLGVVFGNIFTFAAFFLKNLLKNK